MLIPFDFATKVSFVPILEEQYKSLVKKYNTDGPFAFKDYQIKMKYFILANK